VAVREILKFSDGAAVASAAADRLLSHLNSLLRIQTTVHLCITGGTVGILTLAKIAEHPLRDTVDWQRVHIWWGDDRFVTEDSPDSNALQAYEALLSKLDLDPVKVHLFPVLNPKSPDSITLQLEAGVYAFNKVVAKFSNPATGFVDFDVTILGMGPDGHIASLFPGHATPTPGVSIIAEHNSPKPPPQRISFTYDAINHSTEIWFVVAGADKSEAVSVAFSSEPQRLPVGRVSGRDKTLWLIDEAAAASIS
jgi:6-phosphogluconolactonase